MSRRSLPAFSTSTSTPSRPTAPDRTHSSLRQRGKPHHAKDATHIQHHQQPQSGSTRKRKRGDVNREPTHDLPTVPSDEPIGQGTSGEELAVAVVDGDGAEADREKELEAWQDFALDHYEVVEQLPLELHRNYRLLRELDEGCMTQTEKLHKLIRGYIALRLGYSSILMDPNTDPNSNPVVSITNDPSSATNGDDNAHPAQLFHAAAASSTAGPTQTTVHPAMTPLAAEASTSIAPMVQVVPMRSSPPPVHAPPATALIRQAGVSNIPDQSSVEGAIDTRTRTSDDQLRLEEATAEVLGKPGNMGVPLPDGQGGLLLSPLAPSAAQAEALAQAEGSSMAINGPVEETDIDVARGVEEEEEEEEVEEVEEEEELEEPLEEGRKAFPSGGQERAQNTDTAPRNNDNAPAEEDRSPEDAARSEVHDEGATAGDSQANEKKQDDIPDSGPNRPSDPLQPAPSVEQERMAAAAALLPEIARLAKEIVRNGEEKVAVAMGAYNSVDRHIRALDSALSTQEASILLGLRPSTHPSAATGGDLLVSAADAGLPMAEPGGEGGLSIGIGGGTGRRGKKGRKGRRSGVDGGEEDAVVAGGGDAVGAGVGLGLPSLGFDADPSEPRYCYCNQISYGQMIGCDNEDCPLEWFHLSCAGLTAAPTGKWLCEVCKGNPNPLLALSSAVEPSVTGAGTSGIVSGKDKDKHKGRGSMGHKLGSGQDRGHVKGGGRKRAR